MPTWNEKQLALKHDVREFQREYALLEATEAICCAMEKAGVNRAELAKRLKTTKGYITQLLNGDTNMTLRTMSDVFTSLGFTLKVGYQPLPAAHAPPTERRNGRRGKPSLPPPREEAHQRKKAAARRFGR